MNRLQATFAGALLVAAACRNPGTGAAPADGGRDSAEATAELIGGRGVIELERGSGGWTPATAGTRIGVSDGLRTPGDGEAELSVDGVRVKIHEHSELRLTAARAGVLRASVRGRIESDVERGKGRIALHVEGSDALAESEGGHFFVTSQGRSAVVAATSGEVAVSTGKARVQIREGQATRVANQEIGPPVEALRRVLLAVRWPGDKTNRALVPVAGRVAAGSRVYVQGEAVEVAPSGEFHAEVKLHDGRQRIAVVTVDPFGRQGTDSTEIVRDQSIPQVRIDAPWKR